MIDVVSIIIAIISLVGSVAAAGFTGWITYYIEKSKRRADTKALTNKYRDPLTLSAYDLQSRLFNIVSNNFLHYLQYEDKQDLVRIYTAFVIGQYLSWVHIFRRQAQFLRFSTERTNKKFNRIMDAITAEFATSRVGPDEHFFMLWQGQQMAIGELMTLSGKDDELHCMGYAQFSAEYKQSADFRAWFQTIDEGFTQIAQDPRYKEGNRPSLNRFRRLQHLLIDWLAILGPDLTLGVDTYLTKAIPAAPNCKCNGNGCTKASQPNDV